jgi:hypothetical protein
MPSDIQVFVKWKDQTIFAGEDVECTITFKNVADTSADSNANEGQHSRKGSRVANHNPQSNSDSFFGFKSPQGLFSGRRSFSISSQRKPYHRTASSVGTPLAGSHSFPPNSGNGPSTPRTWQPGHSHKRSVSILSIDSEGQADASPSSHQYNRPARGHGRSASLQVPPRRNNSYEDSHKKGRLRTLIV